VLLLRSDGGSLAELAGLVDDVRRDLAELVAVLTGVVGAEQQLTARLELDPEVGLSSATVAAVRGAQRGTRGNGSGHIGLISVFVGAGSNVAREPKIPCEPPGATWRPTPDPITPVVPGSGVFHSSGTPVRERRSVLLSVTVPALVRFEIPEISPRIVAGS